MTHNCILAKNSSSIFAYHYPSDIVDILDLLDKLGYYYIELPPILPITSELFYPTIKEMKKKGNFYYASFGLEFHIIPCIIKEKGFHSCFTCVSSIETKGEFIYIESEENKKECILELLQYVKQKSYEILIKEDKSKIVIRLKGG